MPKKLKPQRTPLPAEVSEAVLEFPLTTKDGSQKTVREILDEAVELVEEVNRVLETNTLVSYLAKSLARESNQRREARIRVSLEEGPYLVVGSGDSLRPEKLPSLEELRERASMLGIDVRDLGRQKLKILERLESKAPQSLADEREEKDLPVQRPRIPR